MRPRLRARHHGSFFERGSGKVSRRAELVEVGDSGVPELRNDAYRVSPIWNPEETEPGEDGSYFNEAE